MNNAKPRVSDGMLKKIIAVVTALSLIFLQVPIWNMTSGARAEAANNAKEKLAEQGQVEVPLEFEHAYIVYDEQTIAEPATKVTLPADTAMEFKAEADSGYQIESVKAIINGIETTLEAKTTNDYKLTQDEVAMTDKLIVKAITAPTVGNAEATQKEEPAAKSEPAAAEARPVATEGSVAAADAPSLTEQSTTPESAAAPESTTRALTAANPGKPVTISSDNATVNFSVYATVADRNAGQNALSDDYEIGIEDTLYGAVTFDFIPGAGPTTGRLNYTYPLPDYIVSLDRESETLYDNSGNVAGTWGISNNVAYFNYDEAWALSHPNGGGQFFFDFTLNEDSIVNGDDTITLFPGQASQITVQLRKAEISGSKESTEIDEEGYFTYTVKLHAQDNFDNFMFSDHMDKDLSYVEGSFAFDGTPFEVTITQKDDGSHEATANAARTVAKGDHFITYRARVDQAAIVGLSNGGALQRGNKAVWSYGTDDQAGGGEATEKKEIKVEKILGKSTSGLTNGNKITWTVRTNSRTNPKVDMAGYTVEDKLPDGLEYDGSYKLYDLVNGSWHYLKTVEIPAGARSFSFTFPEDAGYKVYYIQYTTTIVNIDQIDKKTTFKNDATLTPPGGGKPVNQKASYVYTPKLQPGQAEPQVAKEIIDMSQLYSDGIVKWHSTFTSDKYVAEEGQSGLVMQYFDSLKVAAPQYHENNEILEQNQGTVTDANGKTREYMKIWFTGGEPELYADGVKLVKGTDYMFTNNNPTKTSTYGYSKTSTNLAGETVPVAFRIGFILSSPRMKQVVENKTPIDIYYSTKCDGTYQTYYNEGRARITRGSEADYSKSVFVDYTMGGNSKVDKTGTMSYDDTRGKYVAQWSVTANRGEGEANLIGLPNANLTFTDTLPAGMSVVEGSVNLKVVRPATEGTERVERTVQCVRSTQDGAVTFSADLSKEKSADGKELFYDENTGTYAAWAQLTFETELDPSAVIDDGQSHTLVNVAKAESGDAELGVGKAFVSYQQSPLLTKFGERYYDSEPVIHYTIQVNPEARTLLPAGGQASVNLKDLLDYHTTVVPSSIKVVKTATGEEITGTDQCKVSLNANEIDENGNSTSSFVIDVPDATALTVTYDVFLSGAEGQEIQVVNTASLNGVTHKSTENKKEYKVNHSDASVHGSNTFITITKMDSKNVTSYSSRLKGAVFELYRVDMSQLTGSTWTEAGLKAASELVNTVTTDETGTALLYEAATNAMYYDTLYFYQEVQAPHTYGIDDPNPHFVMIEGQNFAAQSAIAASHGIVPSPNTVYNATDTEIEVPVEFYAKKTLNGRTLNAGEFSFELYEDIYENGQLARTVRLQSVDNTADGYAHFDAIKYKFANIGTHYYKIVETLGTKGGVTYDESVHSFTVDVTENDQGSLDVTYNGYDTATGAEFENEYETSGKLALETNKLLDGQKPPVGAYQFQLTDESGHVYDTASNDADGHVQFAELNFTGIGTYTYFIKEVVPEGVPTLNGSPIVNGVAYDMREAKVTVHAIDNGDGTLRFTTEYEWLGNNSGSASAATDNGDEGNDSTPVTFNNVTVPDTSYPLSATKKITGRDFKSGDSFTFTVTSEDEGAPMPANPSVTITPTSGNSASVDFGNIVFRAADLNRSYTYTITETHAGETIKGVAYDSNSRRVKLTVGDANNGTMNVTAEYLGSSTNNSEGITFTNAYSAQGNAVLHAKKTLDGRALKDGEFFFTLTGDNLTSTLRASADADGSVTFDEIPFTLADAGKDFSYTIKEVEGTLGGVTYDKSSHDVKVHVEDNGDGTLAITYDYGNGSTEPPTFRNEYRTEPTSITLSAHKALVGGLLEAEKFSFELKGTSANAAGTSQTAKNAANGTVTFSKIDYDTPDTYEYEIREVIPEGSTDNHDGTFTGADGIVYDGATHMAVVTVIDNGEGELEASVVYDGDATAAGISFGNTKLTRTGFEFNKYSYGRVGTFNFTMKGANADRSVRSGEAIDYSDAVTIVDDGTKAFTATVQNGPFTGEVASIVFPEISFTTNGDFYYLIEEEPVDEGTGLADDRAQFFAHVKVENGEVTSKTFEVIFDGAIHETTDLSFYNNYKVKTGFNSLSLQAYSDDAELTSVYPKAKKYLNDSTDQLVAGEFEFVLIDDATDAVLARQTNDENGDVAFFDEKTNPGLAYSEPGTYHYSIREVPGDEADITYDDSVIALTVKVVQGEKGLEATATYNGPGGSEPAFFNVKRGMDVKVQKVSRYGGEGLADCTYGLWMVGTDGDVLIKEATSDADGYITFKDVALLAGQKYYFKEVEAPKGHTVDPYRTAYFSLNETGDGLVLVEATAPDGWHSATENIDQDRAKAGEA